MKSWLAGFLTFGLMYTLFIVAMFAADWPTVRHPHLYNTLEGNLPESTLNSILKVMIKSRQLTDVAEESTYRISPRSFRLKDGSLTGAIVIANGNVIVLKKDTSTDVATGIAQQYVALLQTHVEKTAREFIGRLIFLLVMPLSLLAMFAFFSRWLWHKVLLLR